MEYLACTFRLSRLGTIYNVRKTWEFLVLLAVVLLSGGGGFFLCGMHGLRSSKMQFKEPWAHFIVN